MTDVAGTYQDGRERLSALLDEVSDDGAGVTVPTCPSWTVHDVMAHVTGVCADILAGRLDGVATDPWTAAQVAARRERSLKDIVAEWNEVAPQVEAIAAAFPERTGEQWVGDMATHEHDVRLALNRPGARDAPSVIMGLDFLVDVGLRSFAATQGLAPLVLRAGDREWEIGEGSAPTVVTTTPFELFRAVTGRRSAAQIRTFDWSSDPEPFLPMFSFGPFTTSAVDIPE